MPNYLPTDRVDLAGNIEGSGLAWLVDDDVAAGRLRMVGQQPTFASHLFAVQASHIP